MFPLRDTARSRSVPLMNWAIIAANVIVFLFEVSLGSRQLNGFIRSFGLVPSRLLASPGPGQVLTIFSSMFMHGGWWHLIGNLWVLLIFGDNVEDRMGHLRYLAFYLLCGLTAGAAHVLLSAHSQVPTVGASGAISGIMSAYIILFPRARVVTFVPLFFLPWLVEIPALIFIGIWFLSQLFNGVLGLSGAGSVSMYGGVAWWAHVGGFMAGLLLVKAFEKKQYGSYFGSGYWQ